MELADKILQKIENHILSDTYENVETDSVELKNLPANKKDKEFTSIKETICAFLNTNGGIVIIGIKEKDKKYIFKGGYKSDFEESAKLLDKDFTDNQGRSVDVSDYIAYKIKDFMEGNVLVVYVEKLPHDKRFVFVNEQAYERKLTGDHIIEKNKILAQEEYKNEIKDAKELFPVLNATIGDLSVDKLNDYIYYINKDVKIETTKVDIESAKPFLLRKSFITEKEEPTILGMLVCGNHLEDFIGNRCQVDCYVKSPNKIAQNKKIFKDNILQLLENSFKFVYSNIQVGVSAHNGGSEYPEYPEDILRECINNSLAHRDYTVDRFVNIDIVPQKHIEIRNPGGFKKGLLLEEPNNEIPLRRIIPNQKQVNPKLAVILKVFNKYEGKGIGMATLVNECLKDNINLPYYKFNSENDISLIIPKGKLFDASVESLLTTFSGYINKLTQGEELTDEQKHVIAYLYKSEIENENYHYTILLTPDNNHLSAIKTLEKMKIIYKHEKSTAILPVFILDRVLMKTNFNAELYQIFGNSYSNLALDYKDCLRCIYKVNTYGKDSSVSASQISNILYIEKYQSIVDLKTLDNFKRKIRNIFNKLENGKFIKKDGKKYIINYGYDKNVFD